MAGTDYPQPNDAWKKALGKATVVAWSSNWDATAQAANLVLPLGSFAEQDGTFVNFQGRMQRINKAIKPINNRKPAVDAAAFTADALGAGKDWTIRNWVSAFNELKKHTNLLKDTKPLSLGPWGVLLEAEADAPAAEAQENAAS